MIVSILGWQDSGKSLTARVLAQICHDKYDQRVISNMPIYGCNAIKVDNTNLRKFMTLMVKKRLRHWCIVCDEIDRLFNPRAWKDKAQTEAIIGLVQSVKLDLTFICTAHMAKPMDVMIRDETSMLIFCEKDLDRDTIICDVSDLRYDLDYQVELVNASCWFPKYDRLAAIL